MSDHSAVDGEMRWANHGRCVGADPDLFFPEPGEDPAPAKAVCRTCPVRRQCLSWALDTQQKHGVWGGMTEGQRRRLRRPEPALDQDPSPRSGCAVAPIAVERHLHLVR